MAPALLRGWASTRPFRNLGPLFLDYLALIALHAAAITAWFTLVHQGASQLWLIPLAATTIVLTGCLQHRIGLMGHEASHYLLAKNRKRNDVLAELLCFFPLWSSLVRYRAKHLGHHLYPNQDGKDPNLAGNKGKELFARFPLPRPSFIYHYYLKFFWPPFVFRNLLDLVRVLSVGEGFSPLDPEAEIRKPLRKSGGYTLFQTSTFWGLTYLIALISVIYSAEALDIPWLVTAAPVSFYLLAVAIWSRMPDAYFSRVPARLQFDYKLGGLLRMTFYTVLFIGISSFRYFAGFDYAPFYLLFWIFPLVYVFPYLMLLREIYQHANLGTGELDNSRIIHADPFTRWAVLGYGNDFHLVHHLYPNIPHYNLRGAHADLSEQSPDYRQSCEVVKGTFASRAENPSLLDALGPNHRKPT